MADDMEQNDFVEPTESDKELVSFVVDHCDRWRDYRDSNYLDAWTEYAAYLPWSNGQNKTLHGNLKRVALITPGTQQAVETRHAEIMEAIFGQGEFFDIKDDIQDLDGNPLDVGKLREQLMEDFAKDKVRKSIDQAVLMGEIYGIGIGEIIVKTEKEFDPATQPIMGMPTQAAIGVMEKDRISVRINPINPKNFLFDPNGTSVEDCMGVAVEKFVSIHKIVQGIEAGVYRKVDINTDPDDADLEPTQESTQYKDQKVRLLTY